ncbi:MAG: hypothetical protein BZ133_05935 [Methanosphaera sp. SHI613]|jgi:UDP-N-acetyl-D-mannosaminuronate dehydrogenase|nr:MAG: hypothetical protein BZ133_05935 [Methanosphaera sp. SHI613]
MKVTLYPDKDTLLEKYSHFQSLEVFDPDNQIQTSLEKTSDISGSEVIIFTQNALIDGKYNTSRLQEACERIRDDIRLDALLIFDTKIPPRTVYKMSKVIDEYDLIPDINMAYTTLIDDDIRVIAATNDTSLEKTIEIYNQLPQKIKTVKHIQTAEIIPLLQNAYTDTVIALSNQTAILSEALTVDLIEAVDMANLKDDIHLEYPQPILKNEVSRDSQEIVRLADEYGEPAQLSQTSRETNNYVAYHMSYMAEKELYLKEHLAMFETTVAVLGVTEDDTLESEENNASLTLVDDFVSRDVEVWVHDDNVSQELIESHGAKKISLDKSYEADCIIIMTDTQEYRELDPEKVEKVIISARPILDEEKFKDKKYSSLGQYRLKKGEML